MITNELISEILELESKARQGPWHYPVASQGEFHTACLIVAMRNNIRALCEELQRLRAENARLEEACGRIDEHVRIIADHLNRLDYTAATEVTEHTGGGPGTVIVVKC